MTQPATPPVDLHDPASYAAPTRECDVIMKGGITSGVVYPLAACRLATQHRLRQLGGSSAGAIAAALAAAAEHGRAAGTPRSGFTALAQLPAFLGENLASLFSPMTETRQAFEVLLASITPRASLAAKLRAAVSRVVAAEPLRFWGLLVVGVALLVWLGFAASSGGAAGSRVAALVLVLALAVIVAALALGVAAWTLLRRTTAAMDARGFGLVNGHDPSARSEPLTDWLTRTINEMAGLPGDGPPLTLGDLWGADATAVHRELSAKADASPAAWKAFDPAITLTTTTTCLSLRRPYQFPFTTDVFHFCPQCLGAYFPQRVTDHLLATSRAPSQVTDAGREISMTCPRHPGTTVRKLPEAPDLPVVLAARLSLSFPVLICAVPLHHIDFARASGKRELVIAWFSDGGITSNFPMQFFDTLLPSRPTFGINLAPAHVDHGEGEVFRMKQTGARMVSSQAVTSVMGLLGSAVSTMQNWSDSMQMEVPGFRDRIVEVSMKPGEGGLNLTMPADTIAGLSQRGDLAGQDLLSFDFEAHQWIRFRTSMASLSEVFEQLHPREGTPSPPESLPQPWTGSYAFSSHRKEAETRDELATLRGLAAQWRDEGYPATSEGSPRPAPLLRQVLRR